MQDWHSCNQVGVYDISRRPLIPTFMLHPPGDIMIIIIIIVLLFKEEKGSILLYGRGEGRFPQTHGGKR